MTDQMLGYPAKVRGQAAKRTSAAEPAEPTPFLALDLARVVVAYESLRAALPVARIHYAIKANSEPGLLQTIKGLGGGYVIASAGELDALQPVGIPARELLYSNPVKPYGHIERAYAAGVRRFAVDSEAEVDKVARAAPDGAVYVRLQTPRARSSVHSEGKFGVPPDRAAAVLLHAARLGLLPYGLTFHVGSQQTNVAAWPAAIAQAGQVMDQLSGHGIALEMLDLGGGFPVQYADPDPVPAITAIGQTIMSALAELPYPVQVVIEPGRFLAAEAGVLAATVLGIADRPLGRWVHLDVGAVNGLMEALETGNELRYPVTDSREETAKQTVHLTGPTCDSQDTIMFSVDVSAGLEVDDRVYLHLTGAYTTCYTGRFNGFPAPRTLLTWPVS